MENYTQFMAGKLTEAANEDYPREKILEAVKQFRSFSASLDEVIQEHGYEGDIDCLEDKVSFMRKAFEREGISPAPRIKDWYVDEMKRIDRKTGFQICFALGLDQNETEDFFKRVVLEKCFDCHIMEEAIYYFCFRNGMNYREAQEVIAQAPLEEAKHASVDQMVFDEETLYTSAIIRELEQFQTVEELLAYLRKNAKKFGYHHAGATKVIQDLWKHIEKKKEGLAAFEKRMIQREVVNDSKDRSVFDIFNQILGLDEYEEIECTEKTADRTGIEKRPLYVIKADRSIKSLLEENPLLHKVAEKNFPSRQAIEKLLKGKKNVDPDSIRKILIFVYFYYFWLGKAATKQALENVDEFEVKDHFFGVVKNLLVYQAEPKDAERFTDALNKQLLDVQYPELYEGNPYDWIFLYCSKSKEPILVFREFIHELYLENEEQIQKANAEYENRQNEKRKRKDNVI